MIKLVVFVAMAIIIGGSLIVTVDAVQGKFQFTVVIKYQIEFTVHFVHLVCVHVIRSFNQFPR